MQTCYFALCVSFALYKIAAGGPTYYMEDNCNSDEATPVSVPVAGETSSVTIEAFRNPSDRFNSCKANLVLETEVGARLGLVFAHLDTFQSPTENFCIDYLDIHPLDSFLTRFCGNIEDLDGNWQGSEDRNLSVTWNRYTTGVDSEAVTKGFKLIVTAFTAPRGGTCAGRVAGIYYCASGMCIDQRWRCDQNDNCGDFSDETQCPHSGASARHGTSLASLALVAALLGTVWKSWKLT